MAALFFVYLKHGVFNGYVPDHQLRFLNFLLNKKIHYVRNYSGPEKLKKVGENLEENKN